MMDVANLVTGRSGGGKQSLMGKGIDFGFKLIVVRNSYHEFYKELSAFLKSDSKNAIQYDVEERIGYNINDLYKSMF